MKQRDESFTLEAAGGEFRVTAATSFGKRIGEAQAPLFQKQNQLQLLMGPQRPHVQFRALFLNNLPLFRLPSRLEVALPASALHAEKLFQLGINTLIFSAPRPQKEISRISWQHFFEQQSALRDQGFRLVLQLPPDRPLEEVMALKEHFDMLAVEEKSSEERGDFLVYERIRADINRLEKLNMPLFYIVTSNLHEKALFELALSTRADTHIAFSALKEGKPHPFFEAAIARTDASLRLVPLFDCQVPFPESLLGRPLYGAAVVLAGLKEGDSALFSLCSRMWRSL